MKDLRVRQAINYTINQGGLARDPSGSRPVRLVFRNSLGIEVSAAKQYP
ncbi:hypothetical protein P4S72_20710 [Vibrio sp. PP-XX7]